MEQTLHICRAPCSPFNPDLPPIELIVEHYQATTESRQQEIDHCLRLNAANPLIDRIHLMTEHPVDLAALGVDGAAVRQVERAERLTFAAGFDYVQASIAAGTICIMANADIRFDDTLALLKVQDMRGRAFALLRYECLDDGGLELHGTNHRAPTYHPNILRGGSQDAWIFAAPLPPRRDRADFYVGGVHLCDSKINWILHDAGLEVTNPCYSLRAIHHHQSQVRNTRRDARCSEPPFHCPSPCHLPVRWELLRP